MAKFGGASNGFFIGDSGACGRIVKEKNDMRVPLAIAPGEAKLG